jgi:NADH-quinone oxidoreductase subunit L
MRRYGNLRKYLPVTFVTFMVAWLAISGIPPFAGFWSKDEILAGAWNLDPAGPALWVVGIVAAVLTAFYMTRLVILTFFGGEERWRTAEAEAVAEPEGGADEDVPAAAHADHGDDHHGLTPEHEPHESPPTMTIPLVVLATLALIGGLLNLPFGHRFEVLAGWLEPVIRGQEELPDGAMLVILAVLATLGAVLGILVAYGVYQQHRGDRAKIEQPVLAHAWYIDDAYAAVVGGPGEAAFQGVADFDAEVVDGAVRGVAAGTKEAGRVLRPLQSGLVRTYALGVAVGAVLLVAFVITRMSL